MFCSSKFNVNICNIYGGMVNVRRAVDQYAERKIEKHQMQAADFLCELLFKRDDHLVLSNDVDLIAKNFMHLLIKSAQIRQFALTCNPA